MAAQVLPCGKLWGPQGAGAGRGRLERSLRELERSSGVLTWWWVQGKVLEREGPGVSVGLVDLEGGWLGGSGRQRRT